MSKNPLPDKYCPQCRKQWFCCKVLGSRTACQCSCVSVGTIRYDPVTNKELSMICELKDEKKGMLCYLNILRNRKALK